MDDTNETKRCPRCDKDKPINEWTKNRASRSGLGSYCRKCQAEYTLRQYHGNGHNASRAASLKKKYQGQWKALSCTSVK